LALAVGQQEHWSWKTTEEVSNYRLKPVGLTFRELVEKYAVFPDELDMQPWKKTGFPPFGQDELYSASWRDWATTRCLLRGASGEPLRLPDVAREFPLI